MPIGISEIMGIMSLAGGAAKAIGGASGGGSGQNSGLMSLGTGLFQQFQANKLKKQADSAMPGLVDPNQAAFLSELNQKRKSLDTGAAYGAGNAAIDASTAGTNEALVRSTGGDAGGTIQALLSSQANAGQAKNNLNAQGAQQQLQYTGMYNALNNAISARSEQLQLYRSQQARAEWAQKQQMANQNTMAGLGMANSGQQHSPMQNSIPDLSGNSGGGMNFPNFASGTSGPTGNSTYGFSPTMMSGEGAASVVPDLAGMAGALL